MIRFSEFKEFITAYPFSSRDKFLPPGLQLYKDGLVEMFYAPFDYKNTQAKVALCGITPGLQQAILCLVEARHQLLAGAPDETVLFKAKTAASFGGAMRANLIRMLDHIGLPGLLGIRTSAELFQSQTGLVHFTSVLRYPVFVRGKNYNGLPDMLKEERLREQIETVLLPEVQSLDSSVIYIPLGPKPAIALDYLVSRNILNAQQVWEGLPHPSGANAERIAFFLGQKRAQDCSSKTNTAAVLSNKYRLLEKVKFSKAG